MLPLASAVAQVAGVVLLIGIVVSLVRAFRERGTRAVDPLERAQVVAIVVAGTGLALDTFLRSDVVEVIWTIAVVVAVVLGVVRWRRGASPLPGRL